MSGREVLKGPLASQEAAIQRAKLRASAVSKLQPRKEQVDAEHWVFTLRKDKPSGRQPSEE